MIPIQIDVSITKEDFWNLNKFVLWNRQRNTVLAMLIGYPIVIFLLFLLMDYAVWISVAAAVVLGAATLAFLFYRFKGRVLKASETPGLLGTVAFEIQEEGFTEIASDKRSFIPWKEIETIQQNDEYIFVFINRIHCHLIPKRDFVSPQKAFEFYSQAVDYLKAGRRAR